MPPVSPIRRMPTRGAPGSGASKSGKLIDPLTGFGTRAMPVAPVMPFGGGGGDAGGFGGFGGMPMAPGTSFSMNDVFGNSSSRGTTNTRQNTHQRFDNTSTTDPHVTKEYSDLADMLKSQIMGKLAEGGLPREYELKGIKDINQTYDVIGKALGNKMAASGMGSSPVARAGNSKLESGRASDIVNMRLGLPAMERQLWNGLVGQAGDLVSRFGLGSTTKSSGDTWGDMQGTEDFEQSGNTSSSSTGYGNQGMDPNAMFQGQMGAMALSPQQNPMMAGANSLSQILMSMYGAGMFPGAGGKK